mgnify:CR=1 FL=1
MTDVCAHDRDVRVLGYVGTTHATPSMQVSAGRVQRCVAGSFGRVNCVCMVREILMPHWVKGGAPVECGRPGEAVCAVWVSTC